jgi:hypothetical protein
VEGAGSDTHSSLLNNCGCKMKIHKLRRKRFITLGPGVRVIKLLEIINVPTGVFPKDFKRRYAEKGFMTFATGVNV